MASVVEKAHNGMNNGAQIGSLMMSIFLLDFWQKDEYQQTV